MDETNRQPLVILFLPQEWETYHRRPHWEAMAKHVQLLIVEPPAGILTVFLRPRRWLSYFKSGRKLQQQSEGDAAAFRPIQLASPGIDFVMPFLPGIDRFLMHWQLGKVLTKLNADLNKTVSFIVHVHQHHFSKLFSQMLQCYEITDLYVIPQGHDALDENHWYTKRARRGERKIVNESEIIITSSKLIYQEMLSVHSSVHYLHNSAEYAHFSKCENAESEIPADIKELAKPVLGFVGYLNHLIDYELLAKLAKEFLSGSVVIIGREQSINKVSGDRWYQTTKQLDNIHYLGFRNYKVLPFYLRGFDICLMPFRLNEWMRFSAPNKTFQYLATGKPVVSTNFTEMQEFENLVYVASDHKEFIEMTRAALIENSETRKVERKKIALENSTENRAVKVMKILGALLEERR